MEVPSLACEGAREQTTESPGRGGNAGGRCAGPSTLYNSEQVGGERIIRIGQRLLHSTAYLRRNWRVTLAVGAIFQNEARYLREWIEFHRRQGVERFYLYENNSSDD